MSSVFLSMFISSSVWEGHDIFDPCARRQVHRSQADMLYRVLQRFCGVVKRIRALSRSSTRVLNDFLSAPEPARTGQNAVYASYFRPKLTVVPTK